MIQATAYEQQLMAKNVLYFLIAIQNFKLTGLDDYVAILDVAGKNFGIHGFHI